MDTKNNSAEDIYQAGQTFIKYVIDTIREPFLILDKDMKIISANDRF